MSRGAVLTVVALSCAALSAHGQDSQDRVALNDGAPDVDIFGLGVNTAGYWQMDLSSTQEQYLQAYGAYIRSGKRWASWMQAIGRVFLVLPCLFFALDASRRPSAVSDTLATIGLPKPSLWVGGGIALAFLGSMLVIWGKPSAIVSGATLLIIYLLVATYCGHCRPMGQAVGTEKQNHLLHVMKNLAIAGGLLALIGCAMPML